jgi:hypothetical protein
MTQDRGCLTASLFEDVEIVMRFEADKYDSYARECLRQAEMADSEAKREKLRDLARVWKRAALIERTAEIQHRS